MLDMHFNVYSDGNLNQGMFVTSSNLRTLLINKEFHKNNKSN